MKEHKTENIKVTNNKCVAVACAKEVPQGYPQVHFW